jgi:Skp family chaperone for outer membrane proteins
MKFKFNAVAAAILAASLVGSNAYAGDPPAPPKKHVTKKPPKPTVEDQIQALRQEFQGQIDGLKGDLAAKDQQLRQAQQTAADAQAAAAKAEADATAQQQATTDNAAAVSTLQTTVTDLKDNAVSLATTVSDETASIKKSIANPTTLHYKGITITPGGFAAGETIYRTKATGGDIPTAFNALPYEGSDLYSLSEFFATARQSRVSLLLEGKTNWGKLTGYYEADWLGTGITSNNNQSEQLRAPAARHLGRRPRPTTTGHSPAASCGRSRPKTRQGHLKRLRRHHDAADHRPELRHGLCLDAAVRLPRGTKSFNHVAFGISAENPQLLYTASIAGNTPMPCSAAPAQRRQLQRGHQRQWHHCLPSIVNYTNQAGTFPLRRDGRHPVRSGLQDDRTECADIANALLQRGAGFDRKGRSGSRLGTLGSSSGSAASPMKLSIPTRNYRMATFMADLKDIVTGATIAPTLTTAGYYPNSLVLGGGGASMRVPLLPANKLIFGAKGLLGPGIGRYGDSTLADVTADSTGELKPIHNVSGLLTVEANPSPRLVIYLNYGGDYAGRDDYATSTATTLGAPSPDFCPTKAGAFTCTATPTAANIAAGGSWGGSLGHTFRGCGGLRFASPLE